FDYFKVRFEVQASSPNAQALLVVFGSVATAQKPGAGATLSLFGGEAPLETKRLQNIQLAALPITSAEAAGSSASSPGWDAYEIDCQRGLLNVTRNGAPIVHTNVEPTRDGWIGFVVSGGNLLVRRPRFQNWGRAVSVVGPTPPGVYRQGDPGIIGARPIHT